MWFRFFTKYGAIGKGLIDVHHTKLVHILIESDITKLEDLALLCANCHRVMHSSQQLLIIQQVYSPSFIMFSVSCKAA